MRRRRPRRRAGAGALSDDRNRPRPHPRPPQRRRRGRRRPARPRRGVPQHRQPRAGRGPRHGGRRGGTRAVDQGAGHRLGQAGQLPRRSRHPLAAGVPGSGVGQRGARPGPAVVRPHRATPHGHGEAGGRRHPRLMPGRRARAGHGLRHPHLLGRREDDPARPARGQAGADPGRRWDPAAPAPGRHRRRPRPDDVRAVGTPAQCPQDGACRRDLPQGGAARGRRHPGPPGDRATRRDPDRLHLWADHRVAVPQAPPGARPRGEPDRPPTAVLQGRGADARGDRGELPGAGGGAPGGQGRSRAGAGGRLRRRAGRVLNSCGVSRGQGADRGVLRLPSAQARLWRRRRRNSPSGGQGRGDRRRTDGRRHRRGEHAAGRGPHPPQGGRRRRGGARPGPRPPHGRRPGGQAAAPRT